MPKRRIDRSPVRGLNPAARSAVTALALLALAPAGPGASAQDLRDKTKLVAQGLDVVGTCGEDFRARIRRQHEKYVRAIREGNIKAE